MFWVFIFAFFSLPIPASATTFTEFSLNNQVEDAQYIVRGRIGRRWVDMAPEVERPYTYWDLSVQEQFGDDTLSGTIIIRQPGGQMGNMGYHIPGAANFNEGENVIVMLRDTQEPAKEVIGLASGKYRVEEDGEGKDFLRNGLGTILRSPEGQPLSLEQFRNFVGKAFTNDLNEADRKIRVRPEPVHGSHNANHATEVLPSTNNNKHIHTSAPIKTPHTTNVVQKDVQKPVENADRSPASESNLAWLGLWSLLAAFVLSAIAAYFIWAK